MLITIPKKFVEKDDLVIIPRKEYESLRKLKKIQEFIPTPVEKRALIRSERNFREGKTFSYDELVRKLGFTG